LPVNVQCPTCGSTCQVDNLVVGMTVKCGKCGQPFGVRSPPAPTAPAGAPKIKMSVKPTSDDEISLVLDGPGAAALFAADPVPRLAVAPPVAAYRLDIGSATSPGRVRTRNEDSFLVHQMSWSNLERRRDLAAIVVADGLGGHEAGDQASGMVIRTIGASLAALLPGALSGQVPGPGPALAATITQAIRDANKAVHQRGKSETGCKGMASTAAVVLVWDGQVRIGHVGDCRVYHLRGDRLAQVTRDQTLVERMVELGQLSPKEALTHPARNEVTQAIGNYADIAPASYEMKLEPGDWLIVACDGLHAHVDSKMLQETIRKASGPAWALAQTLVDMANQGGGSDNCTVVALRCY
jgi:serine/threonine protein phosphatase PrpC